MFLKKSQIYEERMRDFSLFGDDLPIDGTHFT